MMRIAIVTDAWAPQVNGVVRTLQAVTRELEAQGHVVLVVSPDRFRSWPCPTYPEIRLAFARRSTVGALIDDFAADAIHLATEGPLCLAARRWCLARGWPFTTAFHTQFPDYVALRTPVSAELVWRYVRWFHQPAHAVLASTPSVARRLGEHGLAQVHAWGRGVDFQTFGTAGAVDAGIRALPGPVQLYVGRLAVEKNVAAFLASPHPGSKIVIGDGPARADLEHRFPAAQFLGSRSGAELAAAYRAADVFVFPSLTDTFGLVMIEALACGTPVAAFPASGPLDVLDDRVGATDADLAQATARALACDRATCAAYAGRFSWPASARQFVAALATVPRLSRAA